MSERLLEERRRRRRIRRECALVVLVLVLLVGFVVPPASASPASPSAASRVDRGSDVPSAYLSLNNSNPSAGATVEFSLHVTPFNCTSGAPSNQTVTSVTVVLGDGFVFSESPQVLVTVGGPSYVPGCDLAPWNATIPLQYAYRGPGTFRVDATALWGDGARSASNVVVVTVGPAAPSAVTVVEDWLGAATVVVAIGVVVVVVARGRLPRPPSLPPKEV